MSILEMPLQIIIIHLKHKESCNTKLDNKKINQHVFDRDITVHKFN